MAHRTQPPFRADHVGSFLRPAFLLEARERKARGEITPAQLREVEDRAIAEVVQAQRDAGMLAITDGEFRRTYFHIDFLEQLGGVKTDIPVTVKRADGSEELAPPVIRVIDKVRHAKDIQLADFQYLKGRVEAIGGSAAGLVPKVTIPSPTMLHFRGGRAGISREAYPELDPVFYDDVARAYGDELPRSPPPAAPTCRWTTPTWPTCATSACARRRASAATTPTSCRTATRSSSTRSSRSSRPA
jgi:5-methyltetrahydropteroyltriglutamate--homocysteine methyltransferase